MFVHFQFMTNWYKLLRWSLFYPLVLGTWTQACTCQAHSNTEHMSSHKQNLFFFWVMARLIIINVTGLKNYVRKTKCLTRNKVYKRWEQDGQWKYKEFRPSDHFDILLKGTIMSSSWFSFLAQGQVFRQWHENVILVPPPLHL